MNRVARFASAVVVCLLTASCATFTLRPYSAAGHGTPFQEWAPHASSAEWWYVTGVLHDTAGGLWLYQFTIFHRARALTQGYLVDLSLTDYATGQHIFDESATTDMSTVQGSDSTIAVGNEAIDMTPRGGAVTAEAEDLSFHFGLIEEKAPVWHGNEGVIPMGAPVSPDHMSYYYSLTDLATSGTVTFVDQMGRTRSEHLSGSSWVDRQWGRFTDSAWDWFSLRLFAGSEIMLFAFPSGERLGTIVSDEGRVTHLADFEYQTTDWITIGSSRYGQAWTVKLPESGRFYTIRSLSASAYNPNRVLPYWEGLCGVYDHRGRLIGYAVEETTATAHPAS